MNDHKMNDHRESASLTTERRSAYESLARHANVPVSRVVAAAEAGELRGLVRLAEQRRNHPQVLRALFEHRRGHIDAELRRRINSFGET